MKMSGTWGRISKDFEILEKNANVENKNSINQILKKSGKHHL
jgi:hypothetical protein